MANFAKHLVSKKKRRFIEDGFDLDLTFITPRIVAMGYPSEGREGMYRNHMKDVRRFFDSRHLDHYRLYNLCSERNYDPAKFYGRVRKFPFDDHNAPPFLLMEPFCEDVKAYLDEDEKNVAVIHCKAGKGRTGVMIVAYLMHMFPDSKVQDQLDFYGKQRTSNGKGVTIPSQIRYVHYYGRYCKEGIPYKSTPLLLTRIVMKGVPNFQAGTCVPMFTIWRNGAENAKTVLMKSKIYEGIAGEQKEAVLELQPPLPVCDDIKVEFTHRSRSKKEKMFQFWFNTFFIQDNKFQAEQKQIDKANKDKKNKNFPRGFAIEAYFETLELDPTADAAAVTVARAKAAVEEAGTRVEGRAYGSDADLTTTEEELENEWEGLPISDV